MSDERKILIVEDETKIADTLKLGLTEHGYYVEVAYDGHIGFKLFSAHAYNLVILDINLPGINGYELCKKIRAANGSIPIIMRTAMGTLTDKVEGYDAGARSGAARPRGLRVRNPGHPFRQRQPHPAALPGGA